MPIPRAILESLQGGTLFYPCSGPDLHVPLREFAPYITQFWFVDWSYPCRMEQIDQADLDVLNRGEYQLLDRSIWYPASPNKEIRSPFIQNKYPWIKPCVLTEKYLHLATRQILTIHRRRGYGTAALRNDIDSIHVFFYRGDSQGEGGSGTLWLQGRSTKCVLIEEVLKKLCNGGLVVTDGSNCPGTRNPYKELGHFHWNNTIGAEAVRVVSSFKDKHGRSFHCVGYVGEQYGPTLAWQVHEQ